LVGPQKLTKVAAHLMSLYESSNATFLKYRRNFFLNNGGIILDDIQSDIIILMWNYCGD